jgi:hypothetical protein
MVCLDAVVDVCGTVDFGPFHVPFHYPVSFRQKGESLDMTLIAAVWCPDGFAIAADGLQLWANPPRKTEHAEKIFFTLFENNTGFAFAWAGATAFRFSSGHSFDFADITMRAVTELPSYANSECPESYFHRVARKIFLETPSEVGISGIPEADVIFVGYLNSVPVWAEIHFPHSDTEFLSPTVRKVECYPRYFNVFAGSETVLRQMQESGTLSQPLYLSEAVQMVNIYGQTCVANNTTIADCSNLGGHVHVATISKDGFAWAEEA